MKHTPVFPSCKAMVRLAAPQRPGDIQPFNVHVALLGMSVPFVLKRVPPISRAARDDAAGCDHHPTPAHCLPLLPVDHVAFRRRKIGGNLKFFHLRNADVSGVAHMSIRSRTPSETKTRRLPIPQAFFRPRLIPVPRREARRPYHTSRRCQTLSIISAPARAPRGRPGGSFSPIPTPCSSSSALLPRRCTPPSPIPSRPLCSVLELWVGRLPRNPSRRAIPWACSSSPPLSLLCTCSKCARTCRVASVRRGDYARG